MDYAGMTQPKDVDGRSLKELLEGTTPCDWRQDFLYEYYAYPDWHNVKPNKGVRTKKWAYIEYYDFPRHQFELYDLDNDVAEMHNLYGDPEYKEVQEGLAQRMYELRLETGDPDLAFE